MVTVTACSAPTPTPQRPPTASPSTNAQVNPAKISKVRSELPAGYEVVDVSGPASPAAFWGFGPGWTTDPPQCAALAGPATDESTTRGWSASGRGGIVHAVVTGSPTTPAVLGDCARWTITSGNTTGTVDLVDAPAITDATTVGMATRGETVVEGGTQTASAGYTFSAYLGDHLAFVTVVTDPGSSDPPLGREFAADLLVETVSALRG